MATSWSTVLFVAALASGACERDGTRDGPLVHHQSPELYQAARVRAAGLAAERAPRDRVLAAMDESLHLGRANASPEEHWWVYGAHNLSVQCSAGIATNTFFTQYSIIAITFEEGSASSCRVLERAFFTESPRPNPRTTPDATPWSRELPCSARGS
jgi:hypothetical protein